MIKHLLVSVLIVLASLGAYAFFIEPNMVEVNFITIEDTGVDLRIGLVADFQRKDANPEFIKGIVDIINGENLDIIFVAGDFIDHSLDELPSVEPLKNIKSRYGTFAVLGNHDYGVYSFSRDTVDPGRAQKVADYMMDEGTVKILRNELVMMDGIEVAGLDSYWAGLRDESVLSKYKENQYRIVLSHNQDGLDINGDTAD